VICTTQGEHKAALRRLAGIRAYAPSGARDRQHFEKTVLLEEVRVLRCDGQLRKSSAAWAAGLALQEALAEGGAEPDDDDSSRHD
jgi:hypothetical protein